MEVDDQEEEDEVTPEKGRRWTAHVRVKWVSPPLAKDDKGLKKQKRKDGFQWEGEDILWLQRPKNKGKKPAVEAAVVQKGNFAKGFDSEDESEEDRSLGRRFVGSDSEIEEDVNEGSSRAWSGGRRASPPKKMIKPSVSTSKRQRAGRGSAVASKQRPLSHNGKGWDMADDSDDM